MSRFCPHRGEPATGSLARSSPDHSLEIIYQLVAYLRTAAEISQDRRAGGWRDSASSKRLSPSLLPSAGDTPGKTFNLRLRILFLDRGWGVRGLHAPPDPFRILEVIINGLRFCP